MLARFFGKEEGSDSSRMKRRKTSKREKPFTDLVSSDGKFQKESRAQDIALVNADRQLYQHKMPDEENDIGNMLQSHERGIVFPNIAIHDEPPETLEARYRRLMQLQPRVERRRMQVPDHITVKLRKEVEEFPMDEVVSLDNRKGKIGKYEYVLIRRVSLILSPLSSFIDNHSDVVVSILDTRKRSGQVARSLRLQDNKFYRGEFVLDYSFPKESSGKVSLSFAQEVPTFNSGEQWAVCQIFLDLEESDFPLTMAFQETIGQAAVTTSMLQEYEFHPGHLDVALRDSHLPMARELYRRGEITDSTEPQGDRKVKNTYARSGGEALKHSRDNKKGAMVSSNGNVDYSHMDFSRGGNVPTHEASVEPDSEGEDVETTQEKLARMNKLHNASMDLAIGRQHMGNVTSKEDSKDMVRAPTPPKGKRTRFTEIASDQGSSSSGTPVRIGPLGKVKIPE
jgi:hypothetical protein